MNTYLELNPDKDELSCDICGSTDMESCRICKKCYKNPIVILNEEKGCYEFRKVEPLDIPFRNQKFNSMPNRLRRIIMSHIDYYEDGRKDEIYKSVDLWVVATILDPTMNMPINRFCPQSYSNTKIKSTYTEIDGYYITD